jgi:esterase/lipase superfamily enzyme
VFVVTNRVIHEEKTDLDAFGKEPNASGPNELRLVEVSKVGGKFKVQALQDRLDEAEVTALSEKHNLNLDPKQAWFASLRVACLLFERANKEHRHLLVFVHGYNNDIEDVLKTAEALEKLYNVIVVPFSWPANGGGKVSGAAAYLSDKDDARSSATALHRAVQKVHFYHGILTEGLRNKYWSLASERFPDNGERARALFTQLLDKNCQISLNLLCHSMGNYVLKYASGPSESSLRKLVFDNIGLIAADANNPRHESWVQTLPVRNRLCIVINENDSALAWSRRKPGEEQLERLGQHLRNLVAGNAYYIDVTRNKGVGSEHSYFKGKPVQDNDTLHRMFRRLFEGGKVEDTLSYFPDLNVYRS